MRELERLLQLRARPGEIPQVEQQLTQAHPRQRLASRGPDLAVEPRGIEKMHASGLEVAGEALRLAEHGGCERLAAAGTDLLCLRAQTLGESSQAVVRVACRQHILGDAPVAVEDAARQASTPVHWALDWALDSGRGALTLFSAAWHEDRKAAH